MENFGNKIKKILENNGYSYRVRIFRGQDYEKVVIYAGRTVEVSASRRSKKLVAWKNQKGDWEGDLEVAKCQGYKGSAIYLLDYHNKVEPVKHVLFSDIWEENEKEFGGQEKELLKIMRNWTLKENVRKQDKRKGLQND